MTKTSLTPTTRPDLPARSIDLRRHNLALVLQQVAARRNSTRAELARATRLTKGTISTLVGELLDLGLLAEVELGGRRTVGRPPSGAIALNADLHCGVGVEINVDYVAVCVSDLLHRVRFYETVGVDNRRLKPGVVLARAAKMTRAAIEATAKEGLVPAGVVVAVPGIVDASGSRVAKAPNLGWRDVKVARELQRRLEPLHVHVHAENEANLAALGELWLGAGGSFGDYVLVSGEIGVGGGVVVGGELFRGSHGFAGEIGHVVVDPRGPECSCGRRGCLERIAGQEGLLRAAGVERETTTRLGTEAGGVRELLARLEAGQRRACRAVDAAARALAIALTDLTNILDPDTIVLGGIYGQLAPWLAAPLEHELAIKALGTGRKPVAVTASALGPDAAVRGAAALITHQLLAAPGAEISYPIAAKRGS